MPDYTYPLIFPNLQENSRDLETWLSDNVVNRAEGDTFWAVANHQHADAVILANYQTGPFTLSSSLAQMGETYTVDVGVNSTEVMVDVTMLLEASSLGAGDWWEGSLAVGGTLRDPAVRHGDLDAASHGHSVSASGAVSGSAGSAGAHSHTVSGTAASHAHSISANQHNHDISTGSGTSDAKGGHTHDTISSHIHMTIGSTGTTSGHYHSQGSIVAASGGGHTHTSAGSHSHAVTLSGKTGAAQHDHAGWTGDNTASVSGTAASRGEHEHAVSGTATVTGTAAEAPTLGVTVGRDTLTVRWVGLATTDGSGNLAFAAWAQSGAASANVQKVGFAGSILIVPTVLASQLGGLTDLADVDVPTPSDGDVLTWNQGSSLWIAEAGSGASGGGSWSGRMLLMGA